ncbi:MAG: carbamate kinase [Candidatus Zixiibacteriota bacterium]
MTDNKTAVVALGGNAITQPGRKDSIYQQFANTRKSLDVIVALVRDGYKLVISHGNGPQVGDAMLRSELARGKASVLPLGVLVADTEGGMGYMIEQSLQNRLRLEKMERPVVTIITQMLVDRNDSAVINPTKFIGQFYNEEEAKIFAETRSWKMKKDADHGWRRVVASPEPLQSIEGDTIRKLVQNGTIVIAGGGGGIPIYIDEDGNYEGLDAVIDKDLASAVIAKEIGAGVFIILTFVDKVSINFGQPDQTDLDMVTLTEVKKLYDAGHFPPGSMGPKIKAAIKFLESGGELVTITSLEQALSSVKGENGTRIIPD